MQFELRVPELPLAAVVAAVQQIQQVPAIMVWAWLVAST